MNPLSAGWKGAFHESIRKESLADPRYLFELRLKKREHLS